MSSSYVDGILAVRSLDLRLEQVEIWNVVGAIILLAILAAGVDYGYSLWLRTKLVRNSLPIEHRGRVIDDKVATWALSTSDHREYVHVA